ncbi:Olfactory Receptor 2H1 [Manis pentadactyla]|nr:Olfactory Receptor 2H1 [Manis pentadactyla]
MAVFIETVLFWAVILLYTMIVLSNLTIILLSCMDARLYTPMYFFLIIHSFLDLCYTTTAVPTYIMLVVIAFDHYVTICQPLHYTIIMHTQFCRKLVLTAWLSVLIASVTQSIITFQLPFYTHHHLDDFLCKVPAFICLACGDTSANEWQMTISVDVLIILPVALILTSYVYIAQALRKLQSDEGRKKAFATCSSHLIVVFMFYGKVTIVYTDPKNQFAAKYGKFFAFFYTLFTALLNPLIYTLKNKKVWAALQRLLRKGVSTPKK